MINKKSKGRLAIALAIVAATLTGCGKSGDNSQLGGIPGPITPGYPGGGGNGACAPITGDIPFTGQVYMDSANVIGGPIPNSAQTYGQLGIGGGGGGPYNVMTTDLYERPRYSDAAALSMQLQPTTQQYYNGQYMPGPANTTGTLRLRQEVIADIQYQVMIGAIPLFGQGQNYWQGNMPQICVSAIGMNLGKYNQGLYGCSTSSGIWLYLNGTQRGYKLCI